MFHDTFFTEGISEDTGEKILAAMVCRLKRNDAGPVTVDQKDTRIEKVRNNTRSEERIHLG
jgi:hypothetical protein